MSPASHDVRSDTSPTIVWVVEDHASYRRQLELSLNEDSEGEFICSRSFSDGEEMLRALDRGDARPEVLLTDIDLPGISGVDLIPHVRESSPVTKVLVLTIYEDRRNVYEAICNGASGYLLKTASIDEVFSGIREVLAGGAPLNARIAKFILEGFSTHVPPDREHNLTAREVEILTALVDGLTKKEIAEKLGVSIHTADTHLRHIYEKLQVQNQTGAVAKAIRRGIV